MQTQGTNDGWTLEGMETSYVNDISKAAVTVSLLCRNTRCLFYGLGDQWIKNIDSDDFRCPLCCQLYKPWTRGKHTFPAQKLLKLKGPKNGLTWCFPCRWPDCQEDGWLGEQAELCAREIQTGDDLEAFMRKSVIGLTDLLNKVAMPIGFKKFEWDPRMERKLHDAKCPTSQWEHLKNGIWGDKLIAGPNMPVFEGWPELISLLASLMVGAKGIASSL
jgi:hypothetical protein